MTMLTALLRHAIALPRWQKQGIVFLGDCTLLVASVWVAYSLRIGEWVLWSGAIRLLIAGAFAFFVPTFIAASVYRTIFRYAGVGMMATLVRAFAFYTVLMFTAFMLVGFTGVPRTMGLLQPVVFFLFIAASRLSIRFLVIDLLGRHSANGEIRRILIYGAGQAGQQVASSIRSDPHMQTVAFVDDDERLDGQRLDGVPVLASARIEAAIRERGVTDILLAIPGASRRKRRQILERLGKYKIGVKTLPQAKEIVGGSVSISDIRPVEIEDLLGREPVVPNARLLGRTIAGKTVLVTGAGGSIGSELCRQILDIGPRKLVLFEMSEFALYSIDHELRGLARRSADQQVEIAAELGSVTDEARIESLFARHRFDTVYHAAAYKHVPLVEANPVEGIRNNVLGTRVVAAAAERHGVDDFILISTDKAVRPTNVMGATKRAAEQIVQAHAERTAKARFSIVRFGNVLGSSGSVVPLFRRQIEAGGPITLTDRRVTRYFMTISEAASLVIQAAGMAKGGEVYLLDMSKPVKIGDLAKTMIQLSGLSLRNARNPDGDIAIVEIGLRPGEKLFEELLIGADAQRTAHPRIMKAREQFMPADELHGLVQGLEAARSDAECLGLLAKLVPELEHRRDERGGARAAGNRAASA